MNTSNISGFSSRQENLDPLTELLREGAQKLIQQAVETELTVFLQQYTNELTTSGRKMVIRNGYLPEREIQTGIGPVKVRIPKIRSKNGNSVIFNSVLVPWYVRKIESLEAALPWLYLKGVSTGEMEEALKILVGPKAKGLSASTVAKLKQIWGNEYLKWKIKNIIKQSKCKKKFDK